MGRASTRQNKTPYQLAREELGLSRERAAELLETIPAERIERIESERSLPRPDEVLRMAQRYKKPSLCNAYCARACPIGQEYVPEIKPKELPAIVLEMLATLNTLDRERGCLIDISADGSIDPDELADFLRIQRELAQISRTVEALLRVCQQQKLVARRDAEHFAHLGRDDDLPLRPDLHGRHVFPRREAVVSHGRSSISDLYNLYH